jgi:hypothetical protein
MAAAEDCDSVGTMTISCEHFVHGGVSSHKLKTRECVVSSFSESKMDKFDISGSVKAGYGGFSGEVTAAYGEMTSKQSSGSNSREHENEEVIEYDVDTKRIIRKIEVTFAIDGFSGKTVNRESVDSFNKDKEITSEHLRKLSTDYFKYRFDYETDLTVVTIPVKGKSGVDKISDLIEEYRKVHKDHTSWETKWPSRKHKNNLKHSQSIIDELLGLKRNYSNSNFENLISLSKDKAAQQWRCVEHKGWEGDIEMNKYAYKLWNEFNLKLNTL